MNRRKPKPTDWVNFEEEVTRYVEKLLANGNLGFVPERARLRRPAKYRARDLDKLVRFELSVELFEPGNSNPTQVWIWECKHYITRKVRVVDVRKFADELGQLGIPVKGTIVTPLGFQKGAESIANARGIALWVLKKKVHYRTGLHGIEPPIDYIDIEYVPPGTAGPVSLAIPIFNECFGKKPPRPKPQGREIIEMG